MTKKQMAAGAAAILTVVVGMLAQCPDEPPAAPAAPPVLPRAGVALTPDAGAR